MYRHLRCITGIFKEPVRLHFYGYIPRCGKNRHGIQQRADSGNSRHLKAIPAGQSVLDPVMVSTSGSRLIAPEAQETLVTQLMPLASVITPNIPEAEVLCGRKIENAQDMEAAAKAIYDKIGTDTAVLVKGGHERNTANDCLYTKEGTFWFEGKRVENDNTHGTGCTLSSAIACNLAMGHTMQESVENAKRYITGALQAGLNLGKGSGPLEHTYWLEIQGEK